MISPVYRVTIELPRARKTGATEGAVECNLCDSECNRAATGQASDHRRASEADVVILREVDYRSGMIGLIAVGAREARAPNRIRSCVAELFYEPACVMALGHGGQDDLDHLTHD